MSEKVFTIKGNVEDLVNKLDLVDKKIDEVDKKAESGMRGLKTAMQGTNAEAEKKALLLKSELEQYKELKRVYESMGAGPKKDEIGIWMEGKKKSAEKLGHTFEELKQTTVQSLGAMRKELRSLRNADFGAMSPQEVQKVKKRMAELTDGIDDFQREIRTASADAIPAMTAGLQGIVGAAVGVTGMMSLFGVENKKLQQSMMALMAVSQSLTQFYLMQEQGTLKVMKATIANTAAKIKARIATTALGKAMMALPIGWIVAGLAAIAAAAVALTHIFGKKKTTLEQLGEKYAETFDEALTGVATMAMLEKSISAAEVGTREYTRAVEKYNEKAKEQGLRTIDVNKALSEQTELLEQNRRALFAKALAQAVEQEMVEILKEQIKLQNVLNKNQVDGIARKEIEARVEGLKAEYAEYEKIFMSANEYLNVLDDNNKKQAEAAAKAEKDKKQAEADAAKAKQEAERLAEAWKRAKDATIEYYDKIVYGSMSAMAQLRADYETDVQKFAENLNKKFWSQTQFDNAMRIRAEKFEADVRRMEFEAYKRKIEFDKQRLEWNALFQGQIETDYSAHLQRLTEADKQRYANQLAAINSIVNEEGLTYDERQQMLDEYLANGLISQEQHYATLKILDTSYTNAVLSNINKIGDTWSTVFTAVADIQEAIAAGAEDGSIRQKEAMKKAAIAQLLATTAVAGADIAAAIIAAQKLLFPANVIEGIRIGALGVSQLARIKKSTSDIQKMKHGGRGEFQGASHEQGGIRFGNIEVEGREKFWVLSKQKSRQYGHVMDDVFDRINSGKVAKQGNSVNNISLNDKYTRKIYEQMQDEQAVQDNGKYVIKTKNNRTIKTFKQ